MGSGINSSAQGKYVGNGTGATSEQEIKPGFQPKKIKIWSANGSAEFFEGMASVAKRVIAGDLTFVGGIEFTEFGFKVVGEDVCINDDGVTYNYEAY